MLRSKFELIPNKIEYFIKLLQRPYTIAVLVSYLTHNTLWEFGKPGFALLIMQVHVHVHVYKVNTCKVTMYM